MSVLIKDMRFPKSCYECNLKVICDYASMNGWISNRRDSMCPLVEVKEPHGNLVDLDQMVNDYWDSHSMVIGHKELDEIEVIIEAEGREE